MNLRRLLILFLIGIAQISFGQLEDLRKEVDKIILHDTEIELDKTPGFVIGVIDSDTTFFLSYGNNGLNDEKGLDENSIFEIGSCSKLITAGLIETLVSKNIISYEDKVNDLLQESDRNPRLEKLTIEDLVLHTSGFPKRPSFFGKKEKSARNPYQNFSKEDLLEFYREYVPSKKYKKDTYKYAHTNYALLECILERKFNSQFENILNKYLFQPLQMNRSFVDNTEDRIVSIENGFDRAGRNSEIWKFKSFSASEGLKSSVKDLSAYLQANMSLSNTELDEILPETSQIQLPTNYDKKIYVGKGWHIVDHGSKFNINMHSGTTDGHKAIMAYVEETKTGIVILANSATGTEDLAMLILRMINHNWKRKA